MTPRLFIISGAHASGKDELIKAVRFLGAGRFELVVKYASRPRVPSDGPELVCDGEPDNQLPACDLVYTRAETQYGLKTADIWHGLGSGRSQVCAVSEPQPTTYLKRKFGDLAVSLYIHPEAQAAVARDQRFAKLAEAGLTGLPGSLGAYWSSFQMYSRNIAMVDHVLLHAGASEDLFDQVARLASSYELADRR